MDRMRGHMEKNYVLYGLPERMLPGVMAYVFSGVKPGGFLRAVFSNNLILASLRADEENLCLLGAWARFLFYELPSGCWGGSKAVDTWEGLVKLLADRKKMTADQGVTDGPRKEEP